MEQCPGNFLDRLALKVRTKVFAPVSVIARRQLSLFHSLVYLFL